MDKDYFNKLKEVDLRPKMIKKFQKPEPEILNESKKEKPKLLQELFVQAAEIEALPTGLKRDMQILRLGMIAELDASNLYEKLAELAENNVVKETLLDVSKEEKVHVGEFQSLLEDLDEDYTEALEDGEDEVDDAEPQDDKEKITD